MAPTNFSPAGTSNQKLNSEISDEIHTAIADLTRRLQQLHTLHTPRDENNQNQDAGKDHEAGQVKDGAGVRIITLAGQNSGATMNLPGSSQNTIDAGEGGQRESVVSSNHTTINIYINNNIQGVNNSILYNSSCEFRDPGVRLDVSISELPSSLSGVSPAEEKVVGSSPRAPTAMTLAKHTTMGRKRSLTEFLNSDVDVDDQASCFEGAISRNSDVDDQASCVEGAISRNSDVDDQVDDQASRVEDAISLNSDECGRSMPSLDIEDLCKSGSEGGWSAQSEFRDSNYTEFMGAADSKSKPRKARFLLIRKLLICRSRNNHVVE